MRTILRNARRATLAALCFALVATAPAAADTAYVDLSAGIIVGAGNGKPLPGESYNEARAKAVADAKKNTRKAIERLPVDFDNPDSKTLGDYLASNPSKERHIDTFLDSATVFRETERADGSVDATIILAVEGKNGFKAATARMTGKGMVEFDMTELKKTGALLDDDLREELRKSVAAAGPDQIARPYRIAMPAFVNESGYSQTDIAAALSEAVRDRFQKDRRFEIINEYEQDEIMMDNKIDISDILAADPARKLKLNGIDGVVAAVVTGYEARTRRHGSGASGFAEVDVILSVDLRVLNADTGRWLLYKDFDYIRTDKALSITTQESADAFIGLAAPNDPKTLSSKTLKVAIDGIEGVIRDYFPIEGYVLKVADNRVYINLTRADGLEEGRSLAVYRIGDLLYDPVTGEVIDRIRDRIGSLRAVEVKDTYTHCSTSETPAQPIKPGDVVVMR